MSTTKTDFGLPHLAMIALKIHQFMFGLLISGESLYESGNKTRKNSFAFGFRVVASPLPKSDSHFSKKKNILLGALCGCNNLGICIATVSKCIIN